MAKPKGLGRGLEALLSDTPSAEVLLQTLPVHALRPGVYQPRTHMDEDSLSALADSIRSQGVIQPVVVRELRFGEYEIIAGERRWRAAQLAGLELIPAVIRYVPDEAALAMALIENIQREQLNPLEEAMGIQRLIDEFDMTHERAAQALGRSRSAVSNLLRLLQLAQPVQALLQSGRLDMGHARALIILPVLEQISLAQEIAEHGLSVREVERRTQNWLAEQQAQTNTPQKSVRQRSEGVDPDVARLAESLSDVLGAAVQIKHRAAGAGQVVIEYASLDQLDGILSVLNKNRQACDL